MRAAMARTSRTFGNNDDDDVDVLDSPSEIEVGTLAITINNNKHIQEVWQRPARDPNETHSQFEIIFARVMPPENPENSNIKRYVIYDLSIRHKNHHLMNTDSTEPITIERRYTDFLNLYNGIKSENPQLLTNIYFPKKVLVGNFSPDLIAERSASFETLLNHIIKISALHESQHFLHFLQDNELTKACQYLDERRNELAVPILQNCFRLLNNIYTYLSKPVLLMLCRLVVACTTSPVPHPLADQWSEAAMRRFQDVCDFDLLTLYIPLLHTSAHLWWQIGRDKELITRHLNNMAKKGINVTGGPTLTKAIHMLDPRTETI